MAVVTKLGIVGAGQMGGGIAQVAAAAGIEVVLQDVTRERAETGRANIGKQLEKLVAKGKLEAPESQQILGRIRPTDRIEDFKDCQMAIEAATENVELKLEIFRKLDAVIPAGTVLASNTSSISITRMAAVTKRPAQVIGMHFMNPVPVMKLVEIIRGLATDDATYEATVELAKKLGKEVVTSKDAPGFIVNRILMPLVNEAAYVLQEGLATAKDIDTAMVLGTNQPMGPLALADFIGLDTCLAILEVLHKEIGDPKFRPCPLLRKHVEAGWLGKKTGRGFYAY
jgi:3-hydroxybutyryl-CoA dehydrogenase